MRCPECTQENPDGFRFCGACGAELAPAPARAREERKVATVLFADLVGFTARAERMDPEDVRALLAPYAFVKAIDALGIETPWIAAARAYVEGDFATAAAAYAQIGSRPDAAYATLRLAATHGDLDAPLREALAFYRSVGATRYIREGEALLAAAS